MPYDPNQPIGESGADLDYTPEDEQIQSEYPLLPEDVYPAVVTAVRDFVATTGTLMSEWKVEVHPAVFGRAVTLFDNRLLPQRGVESGKAWSWGEACKATGVNPKQPIRTVMQQAIGRKVAVSTVNETYQGRQRTKVGQMLAPDQANPALIDLVKSGGKIALRQFLDQSAAQAPADTWSAPVPEPPKDADAFGGAW